MDTVEVCYEKILALGRGLPSSHARTPVHQLVAEIAVTKPVEIAVIGGDSGLSYELLHDWATRISLALVTGGIGPGHRVAILIEPSAAMVAAVLGILYCGAAYVPLDQGLPTQRIVSILADANVSGILTDERCFGIFDKIDVPTYKVADMLENNNSTFVLSSLACSTKGASSHKQPFYPHIRQEDPAYLIYTSGSTGEPKGVLIGHGQLSDSTFARRNVYPGCPTFLLVSPLAFDSSVAGLWGTLAAGGRLVVATYDDIRDPYNLIQLIEKHQVTDLLCIPSLYDALLHIMEKNQVEGGEFSRWPSLKRIILAGEVLHFSIAERHFRIHGESVELVNEYGPTEATVWATYNRLKELEPVSIGGPIPGINLYVLNDSLQLVPLGEAGELFIGGNQVALGYFNRPDATKHAFLVDPFSKVPNARMYRTGDLVRWNNQSKLEFIGRKDHQLKIRGHRIELEAVEAALRAMPEIRDAVVVTNKTKTLLIAFILSSMDYTANDIQTQLSLTLPTVMIPTWVYTLDQFPLTISGKVDRFALTIKAEDDLHSIINKTPTQSCSKSVPLDKTIEKQEPYNDNKLIEETANVTAAWREVLNVSSVPVDVNFFDLGGHSLMIFKLQDALERNTGKRPTVVSLFRHTTISTQAKMIYGEGSEVNREVERQISAPQERLAFRRQARVMRTQNSNIKSETAI